LLAPLLGALLAINLFGHEILRVTALEFQAEVRIPARPETRIVVPPLGEIVASTHRAPLLVRLTLKSIDVPAVSELLATPARAGGLMVKLREEMKASIWRYLLKLLALSALGGSGGMFLLRRKDAMSYLRAAAFGTLWVGVLGGFAYLTFDQTAFAHPEYHGALQYVPSVANYAQKALEDIGLVSEQVRLLAEGFRELSAALAQLDFQYSLEESLRLLHVSDIHNHPAAYELVAQAATAFKVQAIIDTGDITDYGTPLEGELVRRLHKLPLPYYYVPGNHDTPSIIETLKALPEVKILSGRPTIIAGLRVVGLSDPAASRHTSQVGGDQERAAAARNLGRLVSHTNPKPHLVAVHNPELAVQVWGKVPVVLAGHTHRPGVEVKKGTVLVNAGSTGAAGIRGLVGKEGTCYSVAVLYWKNWGEDYQLAAVDLIRIPVGRNGLILERRFLGVPKVYSGKGAVEHAPVRSGGTGVDHKGEA
jgi:predicted phosphodiesterase